MRKVFIASLLIITFFSCRKGRLDDYYDQIKGKWRWVYSYGHTVPPLTYNEYTFQAVPSHSVEFNQHAKIIFYSDGNKSDTKVIKKMSSSENILNGYIGYTFDLKGGEQMNMNLTFDSNSPGSHDSLRIINYYPLDQSKDGHDTIYYYNVFVKE